MRARADGSLTLSPTDLTYFLACRHRTALELSVAKGVRTRPVWNDPLLEALFAMGEQHEREYVEALRKTATKPVDLKDVTDPAVAIAATLNAMRAGADVIVQAALERGRWYGRPDVLMKVDRPSPNLGAWSYEPADTKLARETRAGTILQLGVYCELLESAQGIAPERFHVVSPAVAPLGVGAAESPLHVVRSYRFHDYAAYFRLVKARFEEEVERGHEALEAANYPDPVEHCDICPWAVGCEKRRRDDDHLSLVAGISRLQRRGLEPRGIITVEGVAALGSPIPFKPSRGSVETYERIRDQARVQIRSRQEKRIVYELTDVAGRLQAAGPGSFGLARLPAPSPGDLFLDLEGDPLAAEGGREYLFGIATQEHGEVRYQSWWADDAAAERRAFESVVDLISARLKTHPDLHVYHYAPYEPSAFKRLMGRYATRAREIDELLRGRRFVDLYAVVRQGLRVGVERYSIKNLEPLYAFARAVDLRDANRALRLMEQAYELDRLDLATPDVRRVVEGYNKDDCVSTLRLRDWLELRREELIATGVAVERPPLVPGEASGELDDKAKAIEALRARLLQFEDGYLLAYLLDWHRREDKASWWEYFRLRELPEEDLLEEPKAVGGLTFVAEVEKIKKSSIHRYAYPPQEIELRPGDQLNTPAAGEKFAELVEINRSARTIDIKVGPSKQHERPTALFEFDHIGAPAVEQALFDLGERAAGVGGVAALPLCPERALLLREPPRLRSRAFEAPESDVAEYAVSIVTNLDRTVLPIQGPPGAGKTHTGARMILAAVDAGLRVGVTATSHKVIRNLLNTVAEEDARRRKASALHAPIRLGHKGGDDDEMGGEEDEIVPFGDNAPALAALADGAVNVLGGTAWLWARPEFADSVDVLFVDEAGQMSLANAVAVARAAISIVLLGDPRQLDQPMKGTHPEGVGISALEHILGGAQTMPRERGLFLPITWRLPPPICAYTSELFYEGKLHPKPGLERRALKGNGAFEGTGVWLVTVDHAGNRSASDEEAAEVARLVEALLAPGSTWIDEQGEKRQLTPADIRIVAPFNAHVHRIREALAAALVGRSAPWSADQIPVGTVDKFQGQEAPLVIYSMATSRPEDAPRGMEFLYSPNRLNVATSRAKCFCIVVCNPRLFEPECRTPRQMQLANGLARYRERGGAEP